MIRQEQLCSSHLLPEPRTGLRTPLALGPGRSGEQRVIRLPDDQGELLRNKGEQSSASMLRIGHIRRGIPSLRHCYVSYPHKQPACGSRVDCFIPPKLACCTIVNTPMRRNNTRNAAVTQYTLRDSDHVVQNAGVVLGRAFAAVAHPVIVHNVLVATNYPPREILQVFALLEVECQEPCVGVAVVVELVAALPSIESPGHLHLSHMSGAHVHLEGHRPRIGVLLDQLG